MYNGGRVVKPVSEYKLLIHTANTVLEYYKRDIIICVPNKEKRY